MELYFPTELPEQLAFVSAGIVALIGLFTMLFPAPLLRAGGFTTGEVGAEGFGATRSTGGLYLGLGLAALALAQDFTYLMLGIGLACGAFGRLLSVFLDRGTTGRNLAVLVLQLVLAALPLGYVFGYF
ncbi:hypothetical protein REJC140_01160 [Pseudorhizobium endolithicum]|uniref:DUF4345 domain-containing protein n=1 Tax=Pseudorhizobium endolithicum TaxID=1191678 RepID=A0ABM8PQE6_9HYPH|nr:DUF4345 domain-containing protein [Pseudorhizobium endolithicum]CAD7042563.1 hypothetical protein REJC140_01160 [Pseudorhizobium endolithicum]